MARCGKQNVPGLLAAEGRLLFLHLFKDVAVAHGSAVHADAAALEGGLKAHVGHGGGDDQAAGEQAAGLQVAGGHQQDRVAVDDVAAGAGQHATVGVAVEGQAKMRAVGYHFAGDVLGVKSAAVEVDVAAVGSDVQEGNVSRSTGVEAAEQLGGNGGCGSVERSRPRFSGPQARGRVRNR